jgi:hypothetical protein
MDGAFGLGEFDPLELLQLLDPALHLAGFGRFGPETGDEAFRLADHGLLVVKGGPLQFQPLRLFHQIVGIVAPIHAQFAQAQLPGNRGDPVEKGPVMGDDDHCPLVLEEKILQPGQRIEIEMVGRLIKEQQGRFFEQQLGQEQPHDPAAGKIGHLRSRSAAQKPRPNRTRSTWGRMRKTSQPSRACCRSP